jgi:hypothetical protein
MSVAVSGEDEELKLWESMFGNAASVTAGNFTIDYREFMRRVKAYGIDQRQRQWNAIWDKWVEEDCDMRDFEYYLKELNEELWPPEEAQKEGLQHGE